MRQFTLVADLFRIRNFAAGRPTIAVFHQLSRLTDFAVSEWRKSSAEEPTSPLSQGHAQTSWDFLLSQGEAAKVYGGTQTSTSVVIPPSPDTSAEGTPAPPPPAASAPQQATPAVPQWSPAIQATLDQPPASLPHRILLGALCFAGVGVAWACLGQVEEIGKAQGQLVPKGQVFQVTPVQLGKVAVIAVEEGQDVDAGQLIAELDTDIAASEIQLLKDKLAADQQLLQQNQALLEKMRLEARSRAEIAIANIQAQEAAIRQAQTQGSMTQQLMGELSEDVLASQERLQRLEPLVAAGGLSQEYIFSVEETLRSHEKNLIQQAGEYERLQVETERLQAELDQRRAEARRNENEFQQQMERLRVDITELQARIEENQNLLNRAEAELSQRFLYAPVDGTVLDLTVDNIGEVVQAGQTIAEIAPDSAPLVLSAIIPDQEAGFIREGMPVQVKMDAYPFQDYGIIAGEVTAIAPNAETDERLGPVYRLEVELEQDHVQGDGEIIPFKAGQTADAEIIIRKRRIIDIFLDPIRKLKKSGIDI